jgi:predicted restriction endonuclease
VELEMERNYRGIFVKGHKGIPNSGNFKKGFVPWNKGLTQKDVRVKKYVEKRNNTKDVWSKKISISSKGKIISDKQKEMVKAFNRTQKGILSHNWKGGITPEKQLIRSMEKNILWRKSVFIKDDFTCKMCGIKGKVFLEAHHIIPFSNIISKNNIKNCSDANNCAELWNVSNGLTLCENCHKQIHRTKI